MDNVTHTLFAATLARTRLGRAGRGTFATLVIASNAPDVDFLSSLRGGATSYLRWHRGPTHGLLGVVGLGAASAALVWMADRLISRRPSGETTTIRHARFGMLAAVGMIAVVCHVLMDLPTSYGTRILSPFDWHWFAYDWMPIIDIYLLLVLALTLVFGEVSKPARHRLAVVALTFMAGNYGLRAVSHQQAVTLAPRLFGPLLPPACGGAIRHAGLIDRWPAPVTSVQPAAADGPHRCLVEIAAVPTFLSPFRWRVIAQMSNGYELHDLDVLDARLRAPASGAEVFWRRSVRYPNLWTAATFAASRAPTASAFLGFARFPAARTFADAQGLTTVRWTDMRFAGGLISADAPTRPSMFNITVQVDAHGQVVSEETGR